MSSSFSQIGFLSLHVISLVGVRLPNILKKKLSSTNSEAHDDSSSVRYYKLSYVGSNSNVAKKNLNKVLNKYCKDTKIKIMFTSYKIGSMFSLKDTLSDSMTSFVVYRLFCSSCNANFINETTRYFSTKIAEHLYSKKASHIYKYLSASMERKNLRNFDFFSCFTLFKK